MNRGADESKLAQRPSSASLVLQGGLPALAQGSNQQFTFGFQGALAGTGAVAASDISSALRLRFGLLPLLKQQ